MNDITLSITCVNGYGEYVTNKISGELFSFIINSPTKNHIRIISALGYTLFESRECIGIQYLSLRTQEIDQNGNRISFSSTPFHLNENLIIEIRQLSITQEPTKIIIRT